MTYVQQICDGYNKKSLMGNWQEERLYPQQPFRTQQQKQARSKDEAITCFDNTGFQRALPRLNRRNKWETASRIVLNDGFQQTKTIMKEEYPNGEQQHCTQKISRPFDRNLEGVKQTMVHPHSEFKPNQRQYRLLDSKAIEELNQNSRDVKNYGSDFGSTLISHPQTEKYANYESTYKGTVANQQMQQGSLSRANRTVSDFNKSRQEAGFFNPAPEETVKPITNLTGELNKTTGDNKEKTDVQRSWVPPRDKAISYSSGKGPLDFKKANIPRNDIQTSLNMNVGAHNVHPKNVPDNYFRHVRQDVTKSVHQNSTFCSR